MRLYDSMLKAVKKKKNDSMLNIYESIQMSFYM